MRKAVEPVRAYPELLFLNINRTLLTPIRILTSRGRTELGARMFAMSSKASTTQSLSVFARSGCAWRHRVTMLAVEQPCSACANVISLPPPKKSWPSDKTPSRSHSLFTYSVRGKPLIGGCTSHGIVKSSYMFMQVRLAGNSYGANVSRSSLNSLACTFSADDVSGSASDELFHCRSSHQGAWLRIPARLTTE